MKIIPLIVICLLCLPAFGQKAEPKGGKGALQIIYYRIDFTQEETDYLRTHSPELIFSVNESGKAKLEKVNDIAMQSIIDSLMHVNDQLPGFYPERVNGIAQQGVYFLRLSWPNYQAYSTPGVITNPIVTYYNPVRKKLSDFSEISYRGPRYDMVIGGFAASFGGNIGTSLNKGWGTKFDFMIYGSKGWGGGFGTTFVIAKERSNDPSVPVPQQFNTHLITMFNGSFGKIFGEGKPGGQLSLQIEPGFGLTDASMSNTSDHALSLGFIPGVAAHYLLPLGKGRMARPYFLPIAYRQFLSFHVAVRQLMFNVQETRGTVYEFGLSYRLSQRPVMNYKLKE